MSLRSTSVLIIFLASIDLISAISCYKCWSINGSQPSCEDRFHGDLIGNASMLSTPCFTKVRGRHGLFPATHCIKLVAYSSGKNPIRYTYRTCGRDENEDQGITRSSHCGFVNLEWPNIQQRFRGCLNVCHRDACNRAPENLLISSKFNICWILFIFNRFYSHHLSISS